MTTLPAESPAERLVLGCALFGGLGSLAELRAHGVSREGAFDLMDAAWDIGVRRFDTADAYGGGASETWIGDWRRKTGKAVSITTKTYNPVSEDGDHGLAPERIRRQAVRSLNRLGTESIDLYLAHEWDHAVPIADTVATFQTLEAEGKIKAWGLSNVSTHELEQALSHARPAAVQNSYSLLRRVDENDVIPLTIESNSAYEAYSPLAGGWLTGKYRPGAPLPADSRLGLVPQWYTHIDATSAAHATEQFRRCAADRGVSAAGLAIAWVLSSPHVARVVIGPKSREHFRPVEEALELRLTDPERAELAAIFASE